MKDKLIVALTVFGLLTACSRGGARANEKDYEVVEEGSATGVTSTIAGPGETLPPITGTNADTTTAFAFNPNAVPPATTTQQGTIAGTLPPMTSAYPPGTVAPSPRPVAQRPPPEQTDPPVPAEPPTTTTTEPPPSTDTAVEPEEEPEEPPPTETSATTTTAPPPPPPPAS